MSGVQTAEAKSHKCGTAKKPSLEEEKKSCTISKGITYTQGEFQTFAQLL